MKTASRLLGKSPEQLQEAMNWAKGQLGGINPNDPAQVQNMLSRNGGNKAAVERALSLGKKAAKTAQFFGVKQLCGIDIDNVEKNARDLLGLNGQKTQYASYDLRSNPAYSGVSYSARASRLPD